MRAFFWMHLFACFSPRGNSHFSIDTDAFSQGPEGEMRRSSTVHSSTVLWQQKKLLTVILTMNKQHEQHKYIAVFSFLSFLSSAGKNVVISTSPPQTEGQK